jgi:hypothetical protein
MTRGWFFGACWWIEPWFGRGTTWFTLRNQPCSLCRYSTVGRAGVIPGPVGGGDVDDSLGCSLLRRKAPSLAADAFVVHNYRKQAFSDAGIAQLVEQLICNQ